MIEYFNFIVDFADMLSGGRPIVTGAIVVCALWLTAQVCLGFIAGTIAALTGGLFD